MCDADRLRVPETDGTVLEVCQSLGGTWILGGDGERVKDLLVGLAGQMDARGVIPMPGATPGGEALGNLWFVHISYVYSRWGRDDATWRATLLPVAKRIGGAIISGSFGDTTMSDGGALSVTGDAPWGRAMELNAMWDNTMGVLAGELRNLGDRGGDHFERLAGRFKRSFVKGFWCEAHGGLCLPAKMAEADHAGAMPEGEQALVGVVPHTVMPRTKQRQVAEMLRDKTLGEWGVKTMVGGKVVESPLLLAWLAEGYVKTSDSPASSVEEATRWMKPVWERLESTGKLSRWYEAGMPAEVAGNVEKHGPTMGEVRRVWTGMADIAGKGIGNSKRTRIESLMPGMG